MKIILDAIGSTPLLKIDGIRVKLEFLNPSGSIKACIAKYMIERAAISRACDAEVRRPGELPGYFPRNNSTANGMSMRTASGWRLIEGIADGFVSGIIQHHRDMLDEIVSAESEEADKQPRHKGRGIGRGARFCPRKEKADGFPTAAPLPVRAAHALRCAWANDNPVCPPYRKNYAKSTSWNMSSHCCATKGINISTTTGCYGP